MSCREYEPLLQGYLEGELSDEELQRVEKHIEECEACRKELDELKKVVALVSSLEEAPAPRDFLQEVRVKVEEKQPIWQRIRAVWARPLRLSHSFGILAIIVVFLGFFVWMNVRELVTKHASQLSREDERRPETVALERRERGEEISESYMYKDEMAEFKDHDRGPEDDTMDAVRVAKSEEERFLDESVALDKSGRRTDLETAEKEKSDFDEKKTVWRQLDRGRDEDDDATTRSAARETELTETQTEILGRQAVAKDRIASREEEAEALEDAVEGGYANDDYSNLVIANGKRVTSPYVGKGIVTTEEKDRRKDSPAGAVIAEKTAGEGVLKETDQLKETAKLGQAAEPGGGFAAGIGEKTASKETRINVPIENYREDSTRLNEIIKREKGTVVYSVKHGRPKTSEKDQPIIVKIDKKHFDSLYKKLSTFNRKNQKVAAKQYREKLAVTVPQSLTIIIVIEDDAK